jgi:hypothetical protein
MLVSPMRGWFMTHPVTFFVVVSIAAASAAAVMLGNMVLAATLAVLGLGLSQTLPLIQGWRRLPTGGGPSALPAGGAQPASRPRAGQRAAPAFSIEVEGGGAEATLSFLPPIRAGLVRAVIEPRSY